MRTDETLALLERDNPVADGDLPEPDDELRRRILAVPRPPRRHGRRKTALRLAAAGAATVAVVSAGVLAFLPGEEASAVARASAALEGSILHTVVVTRTGSSTGTTETWQQLSAPYDSREVGGRELAQNDGYPEMYDARTNTLYVVAPGTKLPPPGRPTSEPARLLRVMRNMLSSGEAREEGAATVDGRRAVRLVAGNASLLVDAETYDPLEWSIVSDDGVRQTSRFRTYEVLPATAANLALLSLRAQHPGAKIEPGITVEGFSGPKDRE
jgi:hypothetical protein